MFFNKERQGKIEYQVFTPPQPSKEVAKIQIMLRQVEVWINAGETELAEKHWILISDECRKNGA
jgi:hypothetical protein